MTARRSPGLPLTIPFPLPVTWTPDQAIAVFELLDDLRNPIFCRYQSCLRRLIPPNRHPDIERYAATEAPKKYRTVAIPAYWSTKQALAVFQLLDELIEQVWAIYHPDLQLLIQRQQQPTDIVDIDPDELPF